MRPAIRAMRSISPGVMSRSDPRVWERGLDDEHTVVGEVLGCVLEAADLVVLGEEDEDVSVARCDLRSEAVRFRVEITHGSSIAQRNGRW